ncbi:AraC family transcriptional regulator [Vallitalea okinawensis]|uniref:AraC family transcriptional regulator n=1 Tax=Vallitalea okinawensis TaxID=2078660 RepID=UPI000CFC4FA0|nr:AraC family transcriptional regulator [Vallitalea okinawensis]
MFKSNETTIIDMQFDKILSSDLDLYFSGKQACPPNHYRRGVRNYYIIHYIVKGNGIYKVDNQTYQLHENQGFLITPNTLTEYKASEANPWEYNWVAFNGTKAKEFLDDVGLNQENPVFTYDKDMQLHDCMNALYDSFNNYRSNSYHNKSLLYQFFYLLSAGKKHNPEEKNSKAYQQDYIEQSIQYIHQNFSRKLTIDEVAQYVGISRKYLYQLFSTHLNISPQKYLIVYRLNHACNLLEKTSLTITEVADSVGYSDGYLFSRMFKKYMNLSPSNWRKH